ncbi:MAG: hypothetical protein CMP67_06240 [Flavobacteriales bacterium]|nr:hypothetical protein [Flavobacteriales bacterium]
MRTLYFLITFFCSGILIGQVTDAEAKLKNATKTDTIKSWKKGALFNLSFSQVTLTNWAAGGNNSISGNGIANFHLTYTGEKCSWENTLILGYGILKQDLEAFQKTDDNIELTSTFGKKASDNWFYSGLINFKSQFTDGFNYPNDSIKISTFLAPGYLLGAAGMNYKLKDFFTLFVSPITSKTTFVLDKTLSESGAFGVTPQKIIRNEIGGYLRGDFKKEVMKNVKMTMSLGLFSNYKENPQNIDINWDLLVLMKVNKFITVSINTNLIYDDDIVISRDKNNDGINEINGPRIQFKEIFGLGFSYKL